MTNSAALLRTMVMFAICLPLAIFLGYTLAGPFNYTFVGVVGGVIFVLLLPLFLRYHYPLLLLGWNATMIIFFLPGPPPAWLLLAFMTLLISIVHRALDQQFRFISVPELTRPLLALLLVVLITAEATGGIKLRSMGGASYGGRQYIFILAAIAGYFALTAQPIPPDRRKLYVALFFLGGLTALIGDVFIFGGGKLRFLAMFFPPTNYGEVWRANATVTDITRMGLVTTRFGGLTFGFAFLYYYIMARYGIRGIFLEGKHWRLALLVACVLASLMGGFRSFLLAFALIFAIQFYLEGLHRTRLLPILLVGLVMSAAAVLPFTRKLPFSVQRTLSFLPVDVDIAARLDAESSSEWRFKLWESLLPQISQYLLLGKGYYISSRDFDYILSNAVGGMRQFSEEQDPMALVGNYHNGPLSVTIPFGIWGDIAVLWLLVSGLRVLYRNYRYGDPELRTFNTLLLAAFVTKVFMFFFIAGALFSDMQIFVGYLGLSVALNGGMARRAPELARANTKARTSVAVTPQQQPAFARRRNRP